MRPFLFIVAICMIVGCSREQQSFQTVGTKIGAPQREMPQEKAKPEPKEHFVGAEQPPDEGKQPKKELPRRIKYTADIRLIVDNLDKADAALDEARKEAKGDYAKVEVSSAASTVRSGTWRVRVPVENFETFRSAVKKIGAVERDLVDSEDITAQYYDLKAHIENRVAARETLRELLKETGKKEMKHYLEVWDKLEQLSDEINRKQGQLKLWENLTDLTTCTIHMREQEKFIKEKPPEPVEVPTFGKRAGRVWGESWDQLIGFGQGIALVAIALTPWLMPLLVLALGGWLLARRNRRLAGPPKA